MAVAGATAIAEIQFADYIFPAFDQVLVTYILNIVFVFNFSKIVKYKNKFCFVLHLQWRVLGILLDYFT